MNIRRFGYPHGYKKPRRGHGYHLNQPRDWRGRWVTSRATPKSGLNTKRAYHLYNPKKRTARGVGLPGLKKNTIPYARISMGGTTVGVNAGTIIPKSHRRIVVGGYARIEHESMYQRQRTATNLLLSRSLAKTATKALFGGQKGFGPQVGKYLNRAERSAIRQGPRALSDTLAGKRMPIAGGRMEARFTSTRKYNPTITIRRGKHKPSSALSQKGTRSFNQHIEVLNRQKDRARKSPRPQRRKAARKRVR